MVIRMITGEICVRKKRHHNADEFSILIDQEVLIYLTVEQQVYINILYSTCPCRHVGFPRSRPDAAEVSVRPDGPRPGERGAEAQVEVAADHAEQRGECVRLGGKIC